MRYIDKDGGVAMPVVELTRRNLVALLAKLDGHPPGSACTLISPDTSLAVRAVEDHVHYTKRAPGILHDDTEAAMHE